MDVEGGHFKTHAEKGAVMADRILTRLKADNHMRKQVSRLIYYHRKIPASLPEVRKTISQIGYVDFALLLKIFETDRISKLRNQPESGEKIQKAEKFMHICQEQNLCCCLKELAINGHDIANLGFRGEEIKFMLQKALDVVISEKYPNQKEILLEFAKNVREESSL